MLLCPDPLLVSHLKVKSRVPGVALRALCDWLGLPFSLCSKHRAFLHFFLNILNTLKAQKVSTYHIPPKTTLGIWISCFCTSFRNLLKYVLSEAVSDPSYLKSPHLTCKAVYMCNCRLLCLFFIFSYFLTQA